MTLATLGTSHSKKHVRLHSNQTKYWDFSWHEIGYYDMPANIYHILNYTNQRELMYIGHSQGGTAYFVMATTRPELNQAVKLMVGLAPGAFYGFESLYLPNSLASIVAQLVEMLKDVLGIRYIDYNLYETVCNLVTLFIRAKNLCAYISFSAAGLHVLHTDKEVLKLLLKVIPDSASIKQLLHYLQLILTAKFKQYDYGAAKNRQIYGSPHPPLYDLKKVTSPVAVFYGIADFQVWSFNSERLIRTLPNVVWQEFIKTAQFTHLDMLLHRDIDKILFNKLVVLMGNYTTK